MLSNTIYGSDFKSDEVDSVFGDDPAAFFDGSVTNMHTVSRKKLEHLQKEALHKRFASLRNDLPMLTTLADEQKIYSIDEFDQAVPLLFEHYVYKSYPAGLLERGRYDLLTGWLNKLTKHDLACVDVSACRGIDEWLQALESQTRLAVTHTSGTSGTMSFLPFSKTELDSFGRSLAVVDLDNFGEQAKGAVCPDVHTIYPNYRKGRSLHLRLGDICVEHISGEENRFHALYPSALSSDVLYLAARLRAAEVNGQLDRLKISPYLLDRREEFEQERQEMPKRLSEFYEHIEGTLAGKKVYVLGTWNILYEMAQAGLDRGTRNLFSPDSVLTWGGGIKGTKPPEDWQRRVIEFTGADRFRNGYAMTEVLAWHRVCEHGHYHVQPWIIPYVLDPNTSAPLPRNGRVTGRAAFFDLSAQSYWGGFVSGDEVTIDWTGDCACGRTSAYYTSDIQRYSEKHGGDDKISCVATPEAHESAMEFLLEFDNA